MAGEADPLQLAAAEGGGRPLEGKIVEADRKEKVEVFADLRVGFSEKTLFFDRNGGHEMARFFNAEAAKIGERFFLDPDVAGERVESAPFAAGACGGSHDGEERFSIFGGSHPDDLGKKRLQSDPSDVGPFFEFLLGAAIQDDLKLGRFEIFEMAMDVHAAEIEIVFDPFPAEHNLFL